MNYLEEQVEILTSKGFKRLQEKSQIVANFDDKNIHISNRLTHSLEVGVVAKMIVDRLPQNLNINKEQVFNICLLHDIGHPSLGHFLERKLNSILKETNYYFEGNANNFIIINKENINISDKTLVSLIKYPIKIDNNNSKGLYTYHFDELIRKLLKEYLIQKEEMKENGYGWKKDNYKDVKKLLKKKNIDNDDIFKLNGNIRTLESLIMEYADDITYLTHDLKDFLIRISELKKETIYLKDIVSLNKYLLKNNYLEKFLYVMNNNNSNTIVNKLKYIMINNIRFNHDTGEIYTFSKDIEIFKETLRNLLFKEFINKEMNKINIKVNEDYIFKKYFKDITNKNTIERIVISGTYTNLINNTKNINKKYRYMANYIAEKTDNWLF